MNKKVLIIIIAVVIVAAAAVGVYLIFSASDYNTYTKAFKNTFDVNDMEMNTTVRATYAGGSRITSTGNFKLKGINTNNTQFINTMTISGQTITQFSDGSYIYTDDGQGNKNRISIGAEPEQKREGEQDRPMDDFSFDAYISEFSGLLDASKIKELNSLEPVAERYVDSIDSETVGSSKRFIVTLLPAAVDELVDSFLTDNLSNQSMRPEVEINYVTYTATVASDYVTQIAFYIDMEVTPPSSSTATNTTLEFVIEPVNPGSSVNFDLPSTDGY